MGALLAMSLLCASPVALSDEEQEVPPAQRWPAWAAVSIGACALVVGLIFQVQSVQTSHALDARSRPPGDWAYTARLAHDAAVRDATVATALWVVGSVACGIGALVFAW